MSVDNFLLSASATDLNYPEIRPSLDLNFARTKTLDPRITFTRSSGGSYVGVNGLIKYAGVNEPRFDHNPVTGESLGLLVEEARTNLLLRSEEFDNASWTKARSTVTANAIVAPDGASTADFIQQSAGQTNAGVVTVTTAVATPTVSIFAKAGTKSRISLLTDATGNSETWFDLVNGTVGTKGSNHTASIVNFGNGWYRCSVSSTVTSVFASIYLADTNGSRVVTDSGGVYLWGAQLEAGAFPTSYIPTTSATVTRSADVASITGANFRSWYRQDEGSFLIAGAVPGDALGTFLSVDNNTANQRWQFRRFTTARARLRLVSTGNNIDSLSVNNVFSVGSSIKMAGSAIAGAQTIFVNGSNVVNATATAMPTATQFSIGSGPAADVSSQTISRLTYYPKRLPNSQLQALTR